MFCFEIKLILEEIFGDFNNTETYFKIGIIERIKKYLLITKWNMHSLPGEYIIEIFENISVYQ